MFVFFLLSVSVFLKQNTKLSSLDLVVKGNLYSNQYFTFFFFRALGGADSRLIYRHYATLYFVFCVDSSESELGILDLIQVRMHF